MSKVIYFSMMFILFTACGSHKQDLFRIDSISPAKNIVDKDPKSLLLKAVNGGDVKAVEMAVPAEFPVDTRNPEGLTLLMIATRSRQFAVMEYLVSEGADTDLKTNSEEIKPDKRAIDYVSDTDKAKDILTAILTGKTFDIKQLNKEIKPTIKEFNWDVFRWLIEDKGADPNYIWSKRWTPLIYMFSRRGVEGEDFQVLLKMFNLLVDHKDIDLNIELKGNTALSKLISVQCSDNIQDPCLNENVEYLPIITKLKSKGARLP
jgi:hypothetical protein